MSGLILSDLQLIGLLIVGYMILMVLNNKDEV